MFFLTALLGEADVLAGQILCPRSPPDSLAAFSGSRVPKEDWIVSGVCAYVPQVYVLMGLIGLSLTIYSRLRGFGTHQSKVISSLFYQIHGNSVWTSDNILFNLPCDEERYIKTLEVRTPI